MKRYLNAIALWFTTIAYVVAAVNPSYGVVLCLGPKNHAAIEFGGEAGCRCQSLESPKTVDGSTLSGAACKDIPLFEVGLKAEDALPTVPVVSLVQAAVPHPYVPTAFVSLPQRPFRSALSEHIGLGLLSRSRRTVTLLV